MMYIRVLDRIGEPTLGLGPQLGSMQISKALVIPLRRIGASPVKSLLQSLASEPRVQ